MFNSSIWRCYHLFYGSMRGASTHKDSEEFGQEMVCFRNYGLPHRFINCGLPVNYLSPKRRLFLLYHKLISSEPVFLAAPLNSLLLTPREWGASICCFYLAIKKNDALSRKWIWLALVFLLISGFECNLTPVLETWYNFCCFAWQSSPFHLHREQCNLIAVCDTMFNVQTLLWFVSDYFRIAYLVSSLFSQSN